MTKATRFPSEPEPEPTLVPRLVRPWSAAPKHICMARVELPDDAIVTLQALCGDWAFGILLRANTQEIVERYPGDGICPKCQVHWRALSS